jgi:hypothetical protein
MKIELKKTDAWMVLKILLKLKEPMVVQLVLSSLNQLVLLETNLLHHFSLKVLDRFAKMKVFHLLLTKLKRVWEHLVKNGPTNIGT